MRVHRIEGLAFCKRVSYAAVTPRYTAPRWLDGRGGGGLEKEEGCKCALLGRAVFQGIFAIKIRVRDSGGRVREAWKIRPIVCQFWIPAMVVRCVEAKRHHRRRSRHNDNKIVLSHY